MFNPPTLEFLKWTFPTLYLVMSIVVNRVFLLKMINRSRLPKSVHLGPVVQSVVSLTSSLRVILLTVLADSIYNIMIFFAEKM